MVLRTTEISAHGLSAVTFTLFLLASACGTSGKKPPQDGASFDGASDARGEPMPDGRDGAAEAPEMSDDGASRDAPADVPLEDVPVEEASTDGAVDGTGDAPEGGEVATSCDAGTIAGSHLVFQFDSKNAEWVKSLQWLDSSSTLTSNLVGYGAGPGCTSPYEFFGQAFAAPEGNGPYPVGGNNLAQVTTCGMDQTIVSQSPDCANAVQTPVTTVYHFYTGAKADQVRITRTIGFDATTPKSTGVGLRVYVPRLTLAAFPKVLIPNGASTGVSTASAPACGGDCFTATGTTWNGKWFADVDPVSGRAMIMMRDPSLTSEVSLTVNSDSSSGSNLSSFVVTQPADGWKAPLTEIVYLCFADLTTWPQAARDAATLPASCGP